MKFKLLVQMTSIIVFFSPSISITEGSGNCGANCIECDGSRRCIDCEEGYVPSGTGCKVESPAGGVTCPVTCSSCTWGTATCISCPSGRFLSGGSCVACDAACLTCSSSSTYCQSCQSGHVYLSNQCLASCPSGYVSDGSNVCQPGPSCPSGCQSCSSSTICTQCSSGFYLYNNVCGTSCPMATYSDSSNWVCTACSDGCSSCSSAGCSSCSSSYFLSGNQCIQNCPVGTYGDTGSGQCTACPSSCAVCSSAGCSSCYNSYFLSGIQCIQNCPVGTYGDTGSGQCTACADGCSSCSSAGCSSCSSSYFLSGIQCTQSCPVGTYGDTGSGQCTTCPNGCATCSSSTVCSSCSQNNFLSGSSCVGSCPLTKYGDSASWKCQDCPSNCDVCANGNQCTTCSSGHFLYQGKCYSPCPSSTFTSGTNCLDCLSNCEVCNDGTSCSKCAAPKLLFSNNQCLDSCPDPYYPSNGVCTHCEEGCTSCTGPSQCKACEPKYFLENGVCKHCKTECSTCTSLDVCQTCEPAFVFYSQSCPDTCPMGTFDSSKICLNCATGCKDCTGLTSCSVCKDGYYLDNGICYECDVSCSTCTSPSLCQTCEPAYVFYNQSCPTTCPPGTWNSTKTSCPTGCATCTTNTTCQTCTFGYNLYTGTVCTVDVNEEQAKQVEQVTKATEAAGTASSAVGSAYGFLNSGDPSAMFMGTLAKMLQYVKYIDVVYPPKIKMMFEAQSKVNKTDNSSSFITKIQDNIKGAFYEAPLPGTFGYYQLHSSFVSNFLQSLLTLSAIAFLIVLLEILTRVISNSSKTHKVLSGILDIFKWNLFLIMFCGMYGDIIFFSSLEFKTANFSELSSSISFTICILVNVLAALVLIRMVQVNLNLKSSRKNRIAKNHQTQSMQDAVERWRSYKPFFEAYKNYTFSQQSFMLFFIIRVSLFYAVVAYLTEYPIIQVILINIISFGMISYLILGRPFAKVINTLNQVVFECTLLAFNVCVLILTFYDGANAYDFKKRESIGNVMMMINMVAGVVSMLFICLKMIFMLKEIYQDWRRSKRRSTQKTWKRASTKNNNTTLQIVTDNTLSSDQTLAPNSVASHGQLRSSANTNTSDLAITNLDQTIDMSHLSSPNTRPHRLVNNNSPLQRDHRINYSNFHQNIRQILRPEDTIKSSVTTSSRKSSKIRKTKKNKKLQEELRKLEEERKEQINKSRGMYTTEAKKKRRPIHNNNDMFNS